MTFLFINTLYYPNQVGGAEVSVQLLCEALAGRGHRIYVVSLDKQKAVKKINGVTAIFLKTNNLYSITGKERHSSWKKMLWHLIDLYNVFYRRSIRTIIRRVRPDIINTNNIQGFSVYLWKIIQASGVPVVHTLRDYYLLCHRTTMFRNNCNCNTLCTSCRLGYEVKKRFSHLPKGYIGISAFILQQHVAFSFVGHAALETIANIVVPPGGPVALPVLEGQRVVMGYIGRVTPEKGLDYLFHEMQRLPADAAFTLLLAGRYEPAYQAVLLQQRLPAGINIQFAGSMDPAVFYRQVHLVIVPSRWNEPFGRIPVEAMSYGRPSCIARSGGLAELYEPDCMWQFEMQPGSLSAVLQQVLAHPEQLAAKAAHCHRFLHKYEARTIAGRFEAFVTGIVQQKQLHE